MAGIKRYKPKEFTLEMINNSATDIRELNRTLDASLAEPFSSNLEECYSPRHQLIWTSYQPEHGSPHHPFLHQHHHPYHLTSQHLSPLIRQA